MKQEGTKMQLSIAFVSMFAIGETKYVLPFRTHLVHKEDERNGNEQKNKIK